MCHLVCCVSFSLNSFDFLSQSSHALIQQMFSKIETTKKIESVMNHCNPCVANKMIDGKQMTLCWHVDNIKASHENPKVVCQVAIQIGCDPWQHHGHAWLVMAGTS